MSREHCYAVYIMTNQKHGTLYVGMTNDLPRRVLEHQQGMVDGFTRKYRLQRLVYAEQYQWVQEAIAREKQLKHWKRAWKLKLVDDMNPEWRDLFAGQQPIMDARLRGHDKKACSINMNCHSRERGKL